MDFEKTRHPTKKAKRVRSWYLYEQYKSLENNQLHGAQTLKNKSCQEKILHQELEERRARRQLCDGSSLSESRLSRGITSDTGTLASASTDDFIDNFCDLQESDATIVNSDKTYSLNFDQTKYNDDIEKRAIIAYSEESTSSSEEREIDYSDLKTELEIVKQNIDENIGLQLETMKENIQYFEKYDNTPIQGITSEELTVKSAKQCKMNKSNKYDNSLFEMWSKLVSFAYQVIQLNRGNCYYDYSTQFMAAVLVCDILCKGISGMCDILQPYVSPIKFSIDEYNANNVSYEKKHNTSSINSTGSRRSFKKKARQSKLQKPRRQNRENSQSKKEKQRFVKGSLNNKSTSSKYNHTDHEAWQSAATLWPTINNLNNVKSNKWPEDFRQRKHFCNCYCPRLNKIVNPMIKLSRYVDSVLNNLEDNKHNFVE